VADKIEALISRTLESIVHEEVNCIFCGLRTPVPAAGPTNPKSPSPPMNTRISLIRCKQCGKEAPYMILLPL
jgi:hypothetical protein